MCYICVMCIISAREVGSSGSLASEGSSRSGQQSEATGSKNEKLTVHFHSQTCFIASFTHIRSVRKPGH